MTEKVFKDERDRKKFRARRCSIESDTAADYRRAVLRETEPIQRQLTTCGSTVVSISCGPFWL